MGIQHGYTHTPHEYSYRDEFRPVRGYSHPNQSQFNFSPKLTSYLHKTRATASHGHPSATTPPRELNPGIPTFSAQTEGSDRFGMLQAGIPGDAAQERQPGAGGMQVPAGAPRVLSADPTAG